MRPEKRGPGQASCRGVAGSQTTEHMSDITGPMHGARQAGVWAPARGLRSALYLWFSHVLFSCACLDSARAGSAGLPGGRGGCGWGRGCQGPSGRGGGALEAAARQEEKNGGQETVTRCGGALPSSPGGDLPISCLAQEGGHCPPTGLLEGPGAWGALNLLVLCSGPSLEEGDRGMARARVSCLMAEPAFRENT